MDERFGDRRVALDRATQMRTRGPNLLGRTTRAYISNILDQG